MWYDKLLDLDEDFWLDLVLRQPRPSPFLTPSFLKPWAASFAKEVRIGLWNKKGIIMLHRLSQGWELLGGQDLADRLDGLSADPEFWHELRREAPKLGLPLIFPNLSSDSEALKYSTTKDSLEVTDDSPYLALEGFKGDFASYLLFLPKKARHELKRKIAKAQREALSPLTLDLSQDSIDDFLRLHRLSKSSKASFMQSKMEGFFRALCSSLSKAQMLNIWTLKEGDIAISSALEIRFAGVAHLYNSGYNPAYSALSPGLILIARCIEEAMLDGLKEYDFLRGEEPYKYQLGGQKRPVYRLSWR